LAAAKFHVRICDPFKPGLRVRVLLQRVSRAEVRIGAETAGRIGRGLMALVGVDDPEDPKDLEWLANKIVNLRVFDDADGVMNRSLVEIQGEILLVSQFTLFASTRKGNRPSYSRAARPEVAIPLYAAFHKQLEQLLGKPIPSGQFGADMEIELINEGPVALWLDSKIRE